MKPVLPRIGAVFTLLLVFASPVRAGEAERIVAIGGSVTEIVYALGAGERLIARDSTSVWPRAVTGLPDVGYMRQLAAEPIIALGPDLVLAIEDAGPANAIDQLGAAGTRLEIIPDEPSIDGVRKKVRHIAAALDLAERGEALIAEFNAAEAAVTQRLAGVTTRPRVLFLLSVSNGGPPMGAGAGTSAAGIVELSGGVNALTGFTGYKPVSPEAIAAAKPEVILLTYRTLAGLGGEDAVLARPEFAGSPAAGQRRLVVMDPLLLLGFGPRTPEAMERLATALHPELMAGR